MSQSTMLAFLSKIKKYRYFIVKIFLIIFFATISVFSFGFLHPKGIETSFFHHPIILIYTIATVGIACLLFSTLVGDFLLGSSITFSFCIIFGFIDQQKMLYRNEPFLPDDLKLIGQAGTLASMINASTIIILIILMLVFWSGIIVARIFFSKKFGNKFFKVFNGSFKMQLFKQVFLTLVLVFAITCFTFPAWSKNQLAHKIYLSIRQTKDTDPFYAWDQGQNYRENGAIFAFLGNWIAPEMTEPNQYNKSTIEKIVKKYQSKVKTVKSQESTNTQNPDIIYILNESFANPNDFIKDYQFKNNNNPKENSPIEFTESLMAQCAKNSKVNMEKSTVSGYCTSAHMSSPMYGGGTANVEFEALTSFSNYFLSTVPYVNIVPYHSKPFPSVVDFFHNKGYNTLALHPYVKYFYRRPIVFDRLNFDSFIDMFSMGYRDSDFNGQYLVDKFAYEQIEKALENKWSKGDNAKKPKFILAITMQNHVPLKNPGGPFSDTTNNLGNGDRDKINAYLNLVYKTDQANKELLQYLSKRDKPTKVILFGDHLPGIYGKLTGETKQNTPMFIWQNYPIDNQDDNASISFSEIKENVISPMYMTPHLLGIQTTGFYSLLSELEKKLPVLNRYLEVGSSNKDDLTVSEEELMKDKVIYQAFNDYRLIEYDILYGDHYSEELGFFK